MVHGGTVNFGLNLLISAKDRTSLPPINQPIFLGDDFFKSESIQLEHPFFLPYVFKGPLPGRYQRIQSLNHHSLPIIQLLIFLLALTHSQNSSRPYPQSVGHIAAYKNHIICQLFRGGHRSNIQCIFCIHGGVTTLEKLVQRQNLWQLRRIQPHRKGNGLIITILQKHRSLNVGRCGINLRVIDELLADRLPLLGLPQGERPGMTLSINNILPEFVLEALHESHHHNHNIYPQRHSNHCEQGEEGKLSLTGKQLLPCQI